MAERTALRPALLGLALAVLVAHGLAIDWVAERLDLGSSLRPMAKPIFTRMLQPQAPPAPRVAPPPPPPSVKRARPLPSAEIASSLPEPTPTAVVTPKEPPPPPEPAPVVAQAQPAASAPEAVAAAAAPAASAAAPSDTAHLAGWPVDTRLNYRMTGQFRGGPLFGDASVQWQRDGSAYQVRIEADIRPFGGRTFMSQGEVTPQGLAPRAYEEHYRPGGKRRTAQFGPETLALDGGKTVPRPPGLQDTASQFVELAYRFASGRVPLEVGRNVTFWMARPGAVDLWTYDVADRELLVTPRLGVVEAFHLKPRPIANPRGNITAEMWFAPTLRYLPVRIRLNFGEADYLDLLVETIQQR